MDFEEIGRNAKDLLKNKKFVVLCVIVGMVALILWIIKSQRQTTTTTEETTDYYDGSQAIGYGGYGYPYAGSESDSDYDWFYEKMDGLMSSTDEKWENILNSNDEKWESIVDQMNDKYDQMLDKYDQLMENLDDEDPDKEDITTSYGGYTGGYGGGGSSIDEQAIIDQMYANSYMWWDQTTQEGRDLLHDENLYLGGKIGATYDSETGVWSKNGVPLYNVGRGDAIGEASAAVYGTGTRAPSSGSVNYTQNVDYQAAINQAINDGADAEVINYLNTQRNQKIATTGNSSANQNFDPNTDYQALINKAKSAGADQSVINNLTEMRNAKIAAQNGAAAAGGTSKGTTKSAK